MSKIQIGTIVNYALTPADAEKINISNTARGLNGNWARCGDVLPAIVTKMNTGRPAGEHEWERQTCYNLQVFLDGEGGYWAQYVRVGTMTGELRLPE